MSLGLVVSVGRCAVYGFSKAPSAFIDLLAGLGVDGDVHAGVTVKHRSRMAKQPDAANLRQVHLIHAELFTELRSKGFDVGPGEMGENITTQGIDLLGLPRGTILELGSEAAIEVTGLRNPCTQLNGLRPGLMDAVLERNSEMGLIRKAGIMAIVIRTGRITQGDKIRVMPPQPPHERLKPV